MNHEAAADLRESLNDLDAVVAPGEERTRGVLRLARVVQPGYLNGSPMYEVVLEATDPDGPSYLPAEFLEAVTEPGRGYYLRLEDGSVHVRDWSTEDSER